jgi:hypothetical protein
MLFPGAHAFIEFLLQQLPGSMPLPADLTFAPPAGARDVARIPSLNDAAIRLPGTRKGCVIGWKSPTSLPSKTSPVALNDLGQHRYGGPSLAQGSVVSTDTIGHLYTKYGGIIDIGHVRDHADIARFVATRVVSLFKNGGAIDFGDDTDQFRGPTGKRVVTIHAQGVDPSAQQAALLGAVISYDIAMWHEIATKGTWQDYSSFSPEDNYSNLLGALVGYKACLTEGRDYDLAASIALHGTLLKMLPQPLPVTVAAVEFLEGKWYGYTSSSAGIPNVYLFLRRRHMQTGYNVDDPINGRPSFSVTPWRVHEAHGLLPEVCRSALITHPPSNFVINIEIPEKDENGKKLRDMYSLTIQNPSNADSRMFEFVNVANGLDSRSFGYIVHNLRDRLRLSDANVDRPGLG